MKELCGKKGKRIWKFSWTFFSPTPHLNTSRDGHGGPRDILDLRLQRLGELHSDFQKFIRAAVYFRKRKAESEAALTVRADGLSPNQVAVRMKRLFLMRLQWSIARGNARIAGAVGL